MKRKIFFTFLLVLSVSLLLFLLRYGVLTNQPSSSHPSLQEKAKVDRITIMDSDTIIIEKDEKNGWLVNHSFQADDVALSNFLYAFSHIVVKGKTRSKPDRSPARDIIIGMGNRSIHYKLISGEYGEILYLKGAKKYNLVGISGAQALFADITTTDKAHWIEKVLVALSPDDIRKITVNARPDWGDGFIIEIGNKNLVLKNLDGKRVPDSLVSEEKLLMYISYFNEIWFEKMISDQDLKKKIFQERPDYTFTLEKTDGEIVKFNILSILNEKGQADLYRAYLTMQGKEEVFVVKYIMLDLLMQTYSHFIK